MQSRSVTVPFELSERFYWDHQHDRILPSINAREKAVVHSLPLLNLGRNDRKYSDYMHMSVEISKGEEELDDVETQSHPGPGSRFATGIVGASEQSKGIETTGSSLL
jgi:hypothetical protein